MSRRQVSLTGDVADGAITWYRVTGNSGVGVAVNVAGGSATFTIKRRLDDGSASAILDGEDSKTYAASFDTALDLKEGEVFGLGVSSASSLSAAAVLTGRFVDYAV